MFRLNLLMLWVINLFVGIHGRAVHPSPSVDTSHESGDDCASQCVFDQACVAVKISGTCSYVFTDAPRTWEEAVTTCKMNDMTTSSIPEEYIEEFTAEIPHTSLADSVAWLRRKGGHMTPLDDGEVHSDVHMSEKCLVLKLNEGALDVIDCREKALAICQIAAGKPGHSIETRQGQGFDAFFLLKMDVIIIPTVAAAVLMVSALITIAYYISRKGIRKKVESEKLSEEMHQPLMVHTDKKTSSEEKKPLQVQGIQFVTVVKPPNETSKREMKAKLRQLDRFISIPESKKLEKRHLYLKTYQKDLRHYLLFDDEFIHGLEINGVMTSMRSAGNKEKAAKNEDEGAKQLIHILLSVSNEQYLKFLEVLAVDHLWLADLLTGDNWSKINAANC